MGRRIRGSEEAPKVDDEVKAEIEAQVTTAQPSFSATKKIEEIKLSSLPEAEKEAYIRRLTGGVSAGDSDSVPFIVYANIRNIGREKRAGMLFHGKAKSTTVATLVEWDEIFKDF